MLCQEIEEQTTVKSLDCEYVLVLLEDDAQLHSLPPLLLVVSEHELFCRRFKSIESTLICPIHGYTP